MRLPSVNCNDLNEKHKYTIILQISKHESNKNHQV